MAVSRAFLLVALASIPVGLTAGARGHPPDPTDVRSVLSHLARQARVHLVCDSSVRGPAPEGPDAPADPLERLRHVAAGAGLSVLLCHVPGRGPTAVVVPLVIHERATGAVASSYHPRHARPADLAALLVEASARLAAGEGPRAGPGGPRGVHVDLVPGGRVLRLAGPAPDVARLLSTAATLDVPGGGLTVDALVVEIGRGLARELVRQALRSSGAGPRPALEVLSFAGREAWLLGRIPWAGPGAGRDRAGRVLGEVRLDLGGRPGRVTLGEARHRGRSGTAEETRSLAVRARPTAQARISVGIEEVRAFEGPEGPHTLGNGQAPTLTIPDGGVLVVLPGGPAPGGGSSMEDPLLRSRGRRPGVRHDPDDRPRVLAVVLWFHLGRDGAAAP